MWNKIGCRAKIKRRLGENATNFTSRWRHVGVPMIVIRWHFRPPEAPQELNYEFTSQTCFAAHASSRLFSGRIVDRTRESGGNRAYRTHRNLCSFENDHFMFVFQRIKIKDLSVRLMTMKISQWAPENFCRYCKKHYCYHNQENVQNVVDENT